MEGLFEILLTGLVALLIGAVVLGPPILLWWLGRNILAILDPLERRDFFRGFFGIVALNALLYLLSIALRGDSSLPEMSAIMSLALPWVVNLALLIFFALYHRWIALGALALIGFLLVWVVLAGVFFFVGCLVIAVIVDILAFIGDIFLW